MQVLIMGCSRLAALVARSLSARGHHVNVMDMDVQAFRSFSPDWYMDSFIGDGTQADDLRRAGIEQAQAFLALSDNENRNTMAAQVALHTFRTPKVICLVEDPERVPIYSKLGLGVLCPNKYALDSIEASLFQQVT